MSATATIVSQRKFWLNEFRMSAQQSSQELTIAYDELETTTTEDTIHCMTPGIPSFDFQAEGFNSYGAGGVEAVVYPYVDANTQVVCALSTDAGAAGETAYLWTGYLYTYEQPFNVPDLSGFTLGCKPDAKVVRATIVRAEAAATGSGTGTAYQVGSVSASQSVYAHVHCIAFDGTSLDINVESDDAEGFPSAVTRASFTQLTDVGKERISAAGAITDDWWRIDFTFVGTSVTFMVAIGIE